MVFPDLIVERARHAKNAPKPPLLTGYIGVL
jgi:hypothetical protein